MKNSQWLGKVDEKISIPYACLYDLKTNEGKYGVWYLWLFVDHHGNVLKKFGKVNKRFKVGDAPEGAKELLHYKKGDIFAFNAEVKLHDEFNGIKTTLLGRLSNYKVT